jgi:hypothetical protein
LIARENLLVIFLSRIGSYFSTKMASEAAVLTVPAAAPAATLESADFRSKNYK